MKRYFPRSLRKKSLVTSSYGAVTGVSTELFSSVKKNKIIFSPGYSEYDTFLKHHQLQSRSQNPQSFWSAPRFVVSADQNERALGRILYSLENETSFRARALPIALLCFRSIEARESVTCGARAISDMYDVRESDTCARLEPTLGARPRAQFSSSQSPSSCE